MDLSFFKPQSSIAGNLKKQCQFSEYRRFSLDISITYIFDGTDGMLYSNRKHRFAVTKKGHPG